MVHPGRSAISEYRHTIFLIGMVFSTAGFPPVFSEKRLELSQEKLVENGGTEGAPRGHGPPLIKITFMEDL
jgi:hypothetical protein